MSKLAIVAGAGPGLGSAVAKRFSRGGFSVLGLTRTIARTDMEGVTMRTSDLGRPDVVRQTFHAADVQFGAPAVLVLNTAELVIRPFLETSPEDFERTWRSMVMAAVLCSQQTVPRMLARGGGTILVSGATASLRGSTNFAAFAAAKFALRGLAQSLEREFQPQGIHVVHVVLDGIVWTERSRKEHGPSLSKGRCLDPDDIAETYWNLAHQPSSAWSQEVDVRNASERF